MPPKSIKHLPEWSKGFNNTDSAGRIAFLTRIAELPDSERPKINAISAKRLFEFVLAVSQFIGTMQTMFERSVL